MRDIETEHEAVRDGIEDRILSAKLMIGVVAEPGFVDGDGHYTCIFSIAQELDGMVFTGDRMLDAYGRLLLSRSGESEVSLPVGEDAAEIEEFLD